MLACPTCASVVNLSPVPRVLPLASAGVTHSQTFVLLLSQCVFARWFCQKEISKALELGKRFVLVRETDTRHGAARPLTAEVSVRCARCKGTAKFAAPGCAWPSACEQHAESSMVPMTTVGPSVGSDVQNFALIYEELTAEVSASRTSAPRQLKEAHHHAPRSGRMGDNPAAVRWPEFAFVARWRLCARNPSCCKKSEDVVHSFAETVICTARRAQVSRYVLDPAGLELATRVLIGLKNVVAEVPWFSEQASPMQL